MNIVDQEIKLLIINRMPLPQGVELRLICGKWESLSDSALEAANRTDWAGRAKHHWLYGWQDLHPRLRLKSSRNSTHQVTK